jgi:hypothetical protein
MCCVFASSHQSPTTSVCGRHFPLLHCAVGLHARGIRIRAAGVHSCWNARFFLDAPDAQYWILPCLIANIVVVTVGGPGDDTSKLPRWHKTLSLIFPDVGDFAPPRVFQLFATPVRELLATGNRDWALLLALTASAVLMLLSAHVIAWTAPLVLLVLFLAQQARFWGVLRTAFC